MRKLATSEFTSSKLTGFQNASRMPVAVVLDNVRSAYNVGSVFAHV
jgi:hypothetical protein